MWELLGEWQDTEWVFRPRFAPMHCTVSCLICFIGALPRSLQGLLRGRVNGVRENTAALILCGGITRASWPTLIFNQSSSSPGSAAVCPHNPIISDKIFHYVEYFRCSPDQSPSTCRSLINRDPCRWASAARAAVCSVKYCGELGFSQSVWSYGPLLSVKCDCTEGYGHISFYRTHSQQSHRTVKQQEVARE